MGAGCLLYTDQVALTPTTGWGVLHLFCRLAPDFDANALRKVVSAGSFEGSTVIGVGVRAKLPFRADWITGPGQHSRLVIDVARS